MLICIDTSGPHCTVALADPASGALIDGASEHLGRGHAERLVPLIEDLLDRNGRTFADLTHAGCVTGPGSFTGLRVGMACARGLALAADIPCRGVSVFEALRAADTSEATAIVLDAKRGQVWMQCFGASSAEPLGLPTALTPEQAAVALPAEVTHLSGTAANFVLEAADRPIAISSREATVTPAALALSLYRAVDERDGPRPLYLRAPDAKPQAAAPVAA